jgi:hypothetical protein
MIQSPNNDVLSAVRQGDVPVFLLRAVSPSRLSEVVRQLLRDLRATGARLEFHDGAAGEVIQAVNRLLVDVPVGALAGGGSESALRVLFIDNGEKLPTDELRELRRITSGLRGSMLRVVIAERVMPGVPSEASTVGEFGELALVCTLDEFTADVQPNTARDELAVAEIGVAEAAIVPAAHAPRSSERLEIPDVLFDLAKERAPLQPETWVSRWGRARRSMLLVAAGSILLGGILYIIAAQQQPGQPGEPRVYDCGLHPDRESIEVLVGQVARSTPTRVREEAGKFRLEIGPFADQASLEAVRAQLWRIGACQSRPAVERSTSSVRLEVEENV